MSGFIYYKPGKRAGNQVTLAEAKSWGLGYAFDKTINSGDVGGNTPDRNDGFVFAGTGMLGEMTVAMHLKEQTWRKLPNRGDDPIWVGMYDAARPTPETLARAKQLPGYVINLGDDNDWLVPITRQFIDGQTDPVCALPTYLELDDEGNEQQGDVVKLYRHLWDATEPLAQALMGEEADEGEIVEVDQWKLAATLMQANYRVDRGELSALHVFSDQFGPLGIGMLAIDYRTYMRRINQKKTVKSSTEATSVGEMASTPNTSPQEQTCGA